MGKAKPKILKNLNSLYQVFIPNRKPTKSSQKKQDINMRHVKNRSMDTTNPTYYVTFNKDSLDQTKQSFSDPPHDMSMIVVGSQSFNHKSRQQPSAFLSSSTGSVA